VKRVVAREKVLATVKATVDDFAAKPNKVRRARIFAERARESPTPEWPPSA
jgi:hypothetical protein